MNRMTKSASLLAPVLLAAACGTSSATGPASPSTNEAATVAAALEVTRSVQVAANADEVWALVGRFDGLADWHPAVTASLLDESDGRIRILTLGNGASLRERLLERSDAERKFSYVILESPLPVQNYESVLQVSELGAAGGAVVEWSARFNAAKGAAPNEAEQAIAGVFDAGLGALAQRFGPG